MRNSRIALNLLRILMDRKKAVLFFFFLIIRLSRARYFFVTSLLASFDTN